MGVAVYVLGIDDAGNGQECGLKAAALSGLKAIVPVPSGFVIRPVALDAFLSANSLREKVKEMHDSHDMSTHEGALAAESAIKDAFINAVVPDDIAGAVMKAYDGFSVSADIRNAGEALELIKPKRESLLVAVRPSVIRDEGSTFAGILDSFINVSGEDALLRCVRLCWASLFYPRASAYVQRRGVRNPSMSVIVQRMAPSEKSGSVLTGFGGENVLIEALWGPGNAASTGIATPDEYLLNGDGRLLEKNVAKKLWMFERNDYTGITSKVYVPSSRMETQVLTEQEVRKIYELSQRIAGSGRNQYLIDWAIGRNRVMITDAKAVKYEIEKSADEPAAGEAVVSGRFVSRGVASGKVKKVHAGAAAPADGGILVMETSDVGMLLAASGVAGVVTEEGGRLSNLGVVARELSIPALSATHNATSVLSDGQHVKVLADAGKVVLLPDSPEIQTAASPGTVPLQEPGTAGGCTGPMAGIGEATGGTDIEKVLMDVSAGPWTSAKPVRVFAKSASEIPWNAGAADGLIIHSAAEAQRLAGPGVPGMPLWISCAGEADFPSAASLARRLAESGYGETGILVPVVRGRDDVEKYRYGLPAGTKLGVSLKTPAMLLSPEQSCEGVSMVNIELEPLLQLSMGLQNPGNIVHAAILEMVGRVGEVCSKKGVKCCVTMGAQHLTDWNVESLAGRGVDILCVDHPLVQDVKSLLLRIAKKDAKAATAWTGEKQLDGEEKSADGVMPFDLGPSFS